MKKILALILFCALYATVNLGALMPIAAEREQTRESQNPELSHPRLPYGQPIFQQKPILGLRPEDIKDLNEEQEATLRLQDAMIRYGNLQGINIPLSPGGSNSEPLLKDLWDKKAKYLSKQMELRKERSISEATVDANVALFHGEPGTGKSAAARKIAADNGYIVINSPAANWASDMQNCYTVALNQLDADIEALIKENPNNRICVIIDEIETLGAKTAKSSTSKIDQETRKHGIKRLLVFLDKYQDAWKERPELKNQVQLICTTNTPNDLEKTITDRIKVANWVEFKLPNDAERKTLFNHHLQQCGLSLEKEFNISKEEVEKLIATAAKKSNKMSSRSIAGAAQSFKIKLDMQAFPETASPQKLTPQDFIKTIEEGQKKGWGGFFKENNEDLSEKVDPWAHRFFNYWSAFDSVVRAHDFLRYRAIPAIIAAGIINYLRPQGGNNPGGSVPPAVPRNNDTGAVAVPQNMAHYAFQAGILRGALMQWRTQAAQRNAGVPPVIETTT